MSSYKNARDAIQEMYSDTTVSLEECLDNLKELRDQIEILIDAVSDDIKFNQQ